MFRIEIEKDNEIFNWYYSIENNTFYNTNKEPIEIDYTNNASFGKGTLIVRLSLGMKCNYCCKYCSENSNKDKIVESCKDYDKFVDNLHTFLSKYGNIEQYSCISFSFWGGEPLVYFDEIKELAPRLTKKFKNCRLAFSTNGELLDFEKYKFIDEYNVIVGISHDGPGQFVRHHKDILEPGTVQYDVIKKLITERYDRTLFQPVFHKYNSSLVDYINFLEEKLNTNKFLLGELAFLRVYDEKSKEYSLSEDQLKSLSYEIIQTSINADNCSTMRKYYEQNVAGFYNGYGKSLCLSENKVFTTCLVGHNYFSIDLSGNVWTCHNNTGQEKDECGNILKLGNIYTDTYKKADFSILKHRQLTKCKDCFLANICLGGCSMTELKYEEINCLTYFYRKYPILHISIHFLTEGGNIIYIENLNGDNHGGD